MPHDLMNKTARTLVLHIGWHKTGSTSLQNFFHANREVLREQAGIYYPETGIAGTSHRDLSASLAHYADECSPLWDQLGEELRQVMDAPQVLISAEGLHLRDPGRAGRMLDSLPEFERIVVIAYVRQPDEILESWYGQRIRNGDFCGGFKEYLTQIEEQGWLDYEDSINKWRGLSPSIEIKVRPFETCQWHRQDLLQDFCHTLGWPDLAALEAIRRATEDNQGWGIQLLSLVREINRSILTHEEKQRTPGFSVLLHRLDQCEWLVRPEDQKLRLFGHDQRRELRDRLRPVFQRLGVRFLQEMPQDQRVGEGEMVEFSELPEGRRIEWLTACLKAAVLAIDDLQTGFSHYQKMASGAAGKLERLKQDKAMLKGQRNELRSQLKQLQREHRELKRQFDKTLRSRLLGWRSWWRGAREGRPDPAL